MLMKAIRCHTYGPPSSLVLETALGSPLDYPTPGSYRKAMGLNPNTTNP